MWFQKKGRPKFGNALVFKMNKKERKNGPSPNLCKKGKFLNDKRKFSKLKGQKRNKLILLTSFRQKT